ncbi:MAG TPA: aminopeptidase N [Nocardioidaceae bacterium]|nr:aminopeptidase N [Nocardioidaceae bacterium]
MTEAILRSLTRDEAVARAKLLDVRRYDISVDLMPMVSGEDFRAVSRVTFACREPGAETFVDCAAEVVSATLNGVDVSAGAADGRIALPGLAAENMLVVETVQRETASATGVNRSVDPKDGEVYVWTSFEPDDARRAWACFDQPDLKAPHAFTVTAPRSWTVVSNSGEPAVEEVGPARRWVFEPTPPLATYVPVVNAGPFYELRSTRGGYDLGLFCRRTLAGFLDRDAEELFSLTQAGLEFFGERFALPFPQRSYDQVFVSGMGGAMENYGCVTYGDAFVFRTQPSPSNRQARAEVLLHEMAHMWFGDMVTMHWWDDLWLNEAFADFACRWAAERVTEFTSCAAGFAAEGKQYAYQVDRGPTTHPIRQPAGDVATATAGFDAITYAKGGSVLRQLMAYVGEDTFVAGLRHYFSDHAWGNAELEDLMGAVGRADGRDLAGWTASWLDESGVDTLSLAGGGAEPYRLVAVAPDGGAPRPHRLEIGVYDEGDDDTLVRRRTELVDVSGGETPLPGLDDAAGALLLLNDNDLTYACVRPDAESLERLTSQAGRLPEPVGRAVAAVTVWDLLMTGRLAANEVVRCLVGIVDREPFDRLIEPLLSLAVSAASSWSPDSERSGLMDQVAECSLRLAAQGADRQVMGTRALARCAVTEEQLESMQQLAGDNADLRWRALERLAALERYDAAAVAELEQADPDPDVDMRREAVEAARPTVAAKERAWHRLVETPGVPIDHIFEVGRAFWQPTQGELLAPFADRYLAALPPLGRRGMLVAMATAARMFPMVGVDSSYPDRVTAALDDSVTPVVRARVLERTDMLRRMLVARSMTAGAAAG